MDIGEQGVLPAVRGAAPDALVVADGFGCRTQIEQSATGRRALHLAEALALDGPLPADHPEKATARPDGPAPAASRLVTGAAFAALTALGTAAYAALRRNRSTTHHR
ncbi:hypothetical protein [Streptomyces sp. CB02460]|uniref:hypothetical protein n=1 Tax=Streptomyces sp. CB02460 TaxID=1703941 RepID=UPI0009669FD3|nr:hypothetical protein [Streptomyces sp. CB02460]OKJ72999.1 hypothetical protein AMK30_18785 [Streptomyces sp. CB02460]